MTVFFPNRTIPLGGKLTLNKDFSSPLSGSHPFFSRFPHVPPSICIPHPFLWSLHPNSVFSYSPFILFLHYFSSFFFLHLASLLFAIFYYSVHSSFYFFLIPAFCHSYLPSLLPHSIRSPQTAPRAEQSHWFLLHFGLLSISTSQNPNTSPELRTNPSGLPFTADALDFSPQNADFMTFCA